MPATPVSAEPRTPPEPVPGKGAPGLTSRAPCCRTSRARAPPAGQTDEPRRLAPATLPVHDGPVTQPRRDPRDTGRDTKRQHRLTAGEDADVARALMTRIALLGAPVDWRSPGLEGVPPPAGGELYRLRQLLERFTR